MADSSIGWWCARFVEMRQITRWHLVESEIADRLITKCGREMEKVTKAGHLLTANSADDACERCKG